MSKGLISLYSIVIYIVFFLSFVYAIGFLGNFIVPKSIDSGEVGAIISSLVINIVFLGLFVIQHSVMSRPVFKKWFTQFVPAVIERSTHGIFI